MRRRPGANRYRLSGHARRAVPLQLGKTATSAGLHRSRVLARGVIASDQTSRHPGFGDTRRKCRPYARSHIAYGTDPTRALIDLQERWRRLPAHLHRRRRTASAAARGFSLQLDLSKNSCELSPRKTVALGLGGERLLGLPELTPRALTLFLRALGRQPNSTNGCPNTLVHGHRRFRFDGFNMRHATHRFNDAYVLNRNSITSPSLTTYSLPSARMRPASLAPCSPPQERKSS
jgi:hypothetical protein